MPLIRPLRSQAKTSIITVSLLFFFALSYILWFNHTREYYRYSQIANERCASELSSVKYQLDVVSEYKKKMDWMLTEAQKEHHVQKNHVKEMKENYATLKHHLLVCEGQTEELEKECQNLKEELNKAKLDLKELQNVKQELEKCQKPKT